MIRDPGADIAPGFKISKKGLTTRRMCGIISKLIVKKTAIRKDKTWV